MLVKFSAYLDKSGVHLLKCVRFKILLFSFPPIERPMIRLLSLIISTCCALLFALPTNSAEIDMELPGSVASVAAYHRSSARLEDMLGSRSMELGAPIFIRIFKRSSELEVWLQKRGGRFELFKTYIICRYSGELGPKLRVGDKQAPEGFYSVNAGQMNPWSKNHLSFNLGYPNDYDQTHDRSGSALMVHGGCTSIGCYAMTDYYMDEIYTLADAALARGQAAFDVHIFPFRLTSSNLTFYLSSPWYSFWTNLQQGYDLFEKYRLPPKVEVFDKRYVFSHQYDNSIARIGF